MTQSTARLNLRTFAREWEAAWNSHELDRILAHYHPDIVFRSSKAKIVVGEGVLRGISALRDYWSKALERQPNLRFTVVDIFEGYGMVVITYTNHAGILAAETLRFGSDGLVAEASACHRPVEGRDTR